MSEWISKKAVLRICEDVREDSGDIRTIIYECKRLPIYCGGGWISVKERLPEPGKILVTDGKSVQITNGAWLYRASDGETRAPANYGAGITVTHWMPMPEPPEEEN